MRLFSVGVAAFSLWFGVLVITLWVYYAAVHCPLSVSGGNQASRHDKSLARLGSGINRHLAPSQPTPRLLGSSTVKNLLERVEWADAYRYGLKDSRGVGMDCARLLFAPIGNTTRYLAVFHARSRSTKQFEVHIAQSLDLLQWEHLRRIVSNADMPVIQKDSRSGQVLLVFEQFFSSKRQWPCALGIRQYKSVQELISGQPGLQFQFRVPNTLSKIEGTPSIERWDQQRHTIRLWFHWHNEELGRDEVATGKLSDFPGDAPHWTARKHNKYVQTLSTLGVSGNVGGRHHLRFGGTSDQGLVLQEGNIQRPPLLPTDWAAWRVWMYSESSRQFIQLDVKTHQNSTAIANPAAFALPCPGSSETKNLPAESNICFAVLYFIFREGSAKNEGGQLIYYTRVSREY